jgi:hypothetical protein
MLSRVLADGGGADDMTEQVGQLEEVMRRTSICGLGQVALGPVMSVLRLAPASGISPHRASRNGSSNGSSPTGSTPNGTGQPER